ncbi:Uncharacterized protein PBTT_10257 [Plasmodiophora brassicae]
MRAAERPAPLSAVFVVVPMALAIAFTIATVHLFAPAPRPVAAPHGQACACGTTTTTTTAPTAAGASRLYRSVVALAAASFLVNAADLAQRHVPPRRRRAVSKKAPSRATRLTMGVAVGAGLAVPVWLAYRALRPPSDDGDDGRDPRRYSWAAGERRRQRDRRRSPVEPPSTGGGRRLRSRRRPGCDPERPKQEQVIDDGQAAAASAAVLTEATARRRLLGARTVADALAVMGACRAQTPTITYLAWYEAHVEFAALHNMLVDYVGLGDDLRLTPALVGEARRRVVNVVTARVGRKNNGASVERDPAHELFTAYVARARSKRWS